MRSPGSNLRPLIYKRVTYPPTALFPILMSFDDLEQTWQFNLLLNEQNVRVARYSITDLSV